MKARPPARLLALIACLCFASPLLAQPQRLTQSLDGEWQIADTLSDSPAGLPATFAHTVPVPGLAHLARPAFPNVDCFTSRENLANIVRDKLMPPESMQRYWNGKVDQDRNYFWYKKTFRAPPCASAVAWLRINKAQFGTAVWLNGKKIGEYSGCFSAGLFPVEDAIRWDAENTLLVRIGAHPAVLPENFPTGSDFEKTKWTSGIYDSVTLNYCENPVIETIQVAPNIETGEVVIQTKIKNHAATPVVTYFSHHLKTWKTGELVVPTPPPAPFKLQPGEEYISIQTIKIPAPRLHLWTPDDPFLYTVETRTAGDSLTTRFGMRDFRYSAKTQRAMLNGNICYLRGTNITLHRFFEDPASENLPWDEAWVRRLLGDIPKKMNWNYMRFCIGPVPDKWLEICDETGLMIQYEFPVWTGRPEWYAKQNYSRHYDPGEMIRQYKDWMRDNWNHPSLVIWDANNETLDTSFNDQIIPAVRPLDLSRRQWENSFNPPNAPDDPVEYHPYLMQSGNTGKLTFKMSDLETRDGGPVNPREIPSKTNPVIINEYGWLWVNRDGSPTLLTKNLYPQLLGPDATPRQRLDMYAYLQAAKTEYWRAHRRFAGIVHFVYLTSSFPGAYTSDNFADVKTLTLDPAFADYVRESFRPLGVYINFFRPTLPAGATREFQIKLTNDYPRPITGALTLTLETRDGQTLARQTRPFALDALGAADYALTLDIPAAPAKNLILRATAIMECGDLSPLSTGRLVGPPDAQGGVTSPAVQSGDKSPHSINSTNPSPIPPTISRRWVDIEQQAERPRSQVPPPNPVTLTIDTDTARTGQNILGFGASGAWWAQEVGAWPETERRALVRLLYDKNTGLGLDIYRHNIGAGTLDDKTIRVWQRRTESMLNTKTGRYDWSRDAAARRVLHDAVEAGAQQVILFANSPPVSMTINGRGYCDKQPGKDDKKSNLAPARYRDFAAYLGEITEHFVRAEKIPVVALSPVNEPGWPWDTPKQEGCYYSPPQVAGVLKAVAAELKRRNLHVRIDAPEGAAWGDALKYIKEIHRVPLLRDTMSDFCTHSYVEDADWGSTPAQKQKLREWLDKNQPFARLHMSEWCELKSGLGEGMDGALMMARIMFEDLVIGRASTWQWWLAATYTKYRDGLIYYDSKTRALTLTKRYWVMAHFSRNLVKDSTVLVAGTTDAQAPVLAARLPDGRLAVICANLSAAGKTLDIRFPWNESWTPQRRILTDSQNDYAETTAAADLNHPALPAHSVVTLIYKKPPASTPTEQVLHKGEVIDIHNENGDLHIEAIDDTKRFYRWKDGNSKIRLMQREKRWYGSFGLYSVGDNWFGKRLLVSEAWRNFQNKQELMDWLNGPWNIQNMKYVWTNTGLVAGWCETPHRNQINIDLWQVYIDGQNPVELSGARDNAIIKTSPATPGEAANQAEHPKPDSKPEASRKTPNG